MKLYLTAALLLLMSTVQTDKYVCSEPTSLESVLPIRDEV
jgi:hypothetical protein